jgi:hypothetical protein
MNRRSITLGVSVIVLAFAAPGQAKAGGLGDLGTALPETDASVKVQANVKANPDLPLVLPTKRSHGDSGTNTSVKAKGEAQSSGSKVEAGLDGPAVGGSRLGARAGLEQSARVKGTARQSGAKAGFAATGYSSKLDAGRHHGRVSAKAKGHARVRTEAQSLRKPRWSTPSGGDHPKGIVPLRGIGREVGNPIQLSLAGWLIALTAAACLGTSRIVRRLQRARL